MKTNRVQAILKTFYDTYGWKRDEASGRYLGEILHEDLDETTQRYMDSNEMRYQKYFGDGGRFFLDAGCGAEPRQKMSRNFEKHVCVDISLVGLKEARKQLGNSGLYVVADLAALPFKEKSFDGVLASHCLYHIDKGIQSTVLRELYRATKANKNILIFYSSNYNLVSVVQRVTEVVIKLASPIFKLLTRDRKGHGPSIKMPPPLYFYTHNPMRLTKEFNSVDVTCLRTLTKYETKVLGKLHLLKLVVPKLSFVERKFPHALLYIGKYVTIRIQRNG